MKNLNVVEKGVEKASRASKRKGKWATIPEIRSKTLPAQDDLPLLLKELFKRDRIEKKKNVLMYRPKRWLAGGGGYGSGESSPDRVKGQEDGEQKGDRILVQSDSREDGRKTGRKVERYSGKGKRTKPPRLNPGDIKSKMRSKSRSMKGGKKKSIKRKLAKTAAVGMMGGMAGASMGGASSAASQSIVRALF